MQVTTGIKNKHSARWNTDADRFGLIYIVVLADFIGAG
jgi:hypothetical protein